MKEYFSHDLNSRNDRKMVKLSKDLGVAGIGIYWCIIEMLHEEKGYISLSEIPNIAYELRKSLSVIEKVLNGFELFSSDSEKFWSESALLRIEKKESKSTKARESVNNRWNKDTNVIQSYSDQNTIKVKESKVKESKVNSEIVPTINFDFDFFWDLYDKKVGEKEKLKNRWILLSDTEREKIIEHIPKYKQSQPDKEFRKNPETYFNNKSWNDEIIEKHGTNKHDYSSNGIKSKDLGAIQLLELGKKLFSATTGGKENT